MLDTPAPKPNTPLGTLGVSVASYNDDGVLRYVISSRDASTRLTRKSGEVRILPGHSGARTAEEFVQGWIDGDVDPELIHVLTEMEILELAYERPQIFSIVQQRRIYRVAEELRQNMEKIAAVVKPHIWDPSENAPVSVVIERVSA